MKDLIKFRKVKNLHCQNCYFYPESICQFRNHFGCTGSDAYQIVKEEPVKIQTEYEWKKERCDLFEGRNTTNIENAEYHQLRNWLKENKPTNFVACDKNNTKAGDIIIFKTNKNISKVSYVSQNPAETWDFIISSVEDGCKGDFCATFAGYEIDLNNTEGK